MDYEYPIAAAARFIELAGVAVLLPGALLAAAVFAKRLLSQMGFAGAYLMRGVWQPDGVWQAFISGALAQAAAAMPLPTSREGQP